MYIIIIIIVVIPEWLSTCCPYIHCQESERLVLRYLKTATDSLLLDNISLPTEQTGQWKMQYA